MSTLRRLLLPAATALLMLGASPAWAQDEAPDPRINAETGRLNANWPHDRHFDHLHMRLELDFPDMTRPELTGVETLRVASVGKERDVLLLDCRGPTVDAVTVRGQAAGFTVADGQLRITLSPPARAGEEVEAVIRYHRDFGADRGNGLTYSKGNPEAESVTSKFAQIHSQGEAEFNSRWFPCHDFPNEKLTSELIVTVETGYEVVSNGRLASSEPAGEGRTRWHWVQSKPHPAYLVALAIAKFAVVDIGGPESGRPGLSMPVYTPVGTEDNVRAIFGNTPRMIACFEKRFRQPYPWDKYAQVMVRDFAAGGMENTSCTFLTVGTSRAGRPGSRDDLISHELAHQWFGDLVTCHTWAHLWLNEGWASYCEALWDEYREGNDGKDPDAARNAYHQAVLGYARAQRGRNRGFAPAQVAMVSNRYANPDAVFTKTDDPYSKGAMVLHMLRERLGDDAFFNGVAAYLEKFKYSTAESDDFRRCLEEASGQSLERFFAQWCYRPGMPRLAVDLDWDDATKTLSVNVEQTQRIDRLNPAFAFSLPVYLKFEDGTDRWVDIPMEERVARGAFVLASKPKQASVDPNITVFAATTTRKPLAMWLDEAAHGPTLYAKARAVEALRTFDDADARRFLTGMHAGTEAQDLLMQVAGTPVIDASNSAE